MGVFNIFKRRREPNTEAARREFLLQKGRITDGTITDSEIAENGREIVCYVYNIQGVDFESSEFLTDRQRENPLSYAPGARVGVRFDPKNHGNSMLV